MVNPRQRRKVRSGTRSVKSSRRQQSKLRKVDPRGPEAFVKAWDKTKTPRQNWTRLGIMSGKLDPKLSGGVERRTDKDEYWVNREARPDEWDLDEEENHADEGSEEASEGEQAEEMDVDEAEDAPSASTTAPTTTSSTLAKGEGRIIRDASGKIVQIVLGGENGEAKVSTPVPAPTTNEKGKGKASQPTGEATTTPWGPPMEDLNDVQERNDAKMVANEGIVGRRAKSTESRLGIAYGGLDRVTTTKTPLIAELERLASAADKRTVERHASKQESSWLRTLVSAHGEDYGAMSRDRKRNVYQRTEGELKRAIRKAGGVEKLRDSVRM